MLTGTEGDNRKSKIENLKFEKMAKRIRAEVRNAVHRRIRRKVRGTTERPRLAVYRSLNHIYAQVIDDEKAQTIPSPSAHWPPESTAWYSIAAATFITAGSGL